MNFQNGLKGRHPLEHSDVWSVPHDCMINWRPNWSDFGILILLSIIWGSSFILIKKGLDAFSAEQVAGLRITISALAFFPLAIRQWKKVPRKAWGPILVVGLLGSAFPAFLFAFAQTGISSSLAGILNSLTPFFTLLLGVLFFGMTLYKKQLLGVLIGFAGALALILSTQDIEVSGSVGHAMLAVAGAFCYGISGNTVKKHLQTIPAVTISSIAFLLIAPVGIFYLMGTDFMERMQYVEGAWVSLAYVSILALIGTVGALLIFFRLVQRTSAVFSSGVTYLIPFVALIWGWLDGESFLFYQWIGLIAIIAGVYAMRQVDRPDAEH